MSGMAIASVVAWLWMAAQGGTIYGKRSYCTYNERTGLLVNCTLDEAVAMYDKADCYDGPPPHVCARHSSISADGTIQEHVIEIKTRREHKPCYWQQGYGKVCEAVTREIWIDGQRWGVLRESEGK